MVPINETNRYPFELRRIKGLISNRDIKIEIEFNPYRLHSKVFEGGRNTPVKFDQRFYIPIHNKFNILTLKVVRYSKEGILSANKKAEVIKTFSYGLPFLQDENCEKLIKIPLYHNDLVKSGVISKGENDENIPYDLEVLIKDFSDIRTKLYIYPNKNVTEEKAKKTLYKIKDLKLIGFRLRLVLMFILKLKQINEYVFYFKYPRLSYLILLFLVLFTYFFDFDFIGSYVIIFAIMFLFSTSDYYKAKVHPFISNIIFCKMHPMFEQEIHNNEEILKNYKQEVEYEEDEKKKAKLLKDIDSIDPSYFNILTKNMLQEKKNLEELEKEELNYKDDIDDENDEEEEKEDNIKEKISNYFTAKSKKSGISLAFEAISNICFMIDSVCTIFEKAKNLVFWKSRKGTMLVFCMLWVAYLVITFIPIRYFIILFYFKKFSRGKSYYDRIYKNNIEVAKIQICNFLNDKRFDFCSEWPKIKNLEKKLSTHLQQTNSIFLPNDWLKYFPRPVYLIQKIGFIKSVLTLPDNEENELIKRTNKNLYKKTKNAIEKLLDYLMNNIPSDFYLIRYSDQMVSKNYI